MSIVMRAPSAPCGQVSHSNVVTSVAFSPDGRILASGSWDGTVKLWELRTGKSGEPKLNLWRTLRGKWDEVEAVAFTPDGRQIAAVGTGWDDNPFGAVMLWDVATGFGRSLIRMSGKIDTLAFSPDGSILATGNGDREAKLWDVASGQERATLSEHRSPVWSVAFSPDGTTLASASGVAPAVAERAGEEQVGEIRLWDVTRPVPRERATLVGHEYGIVSVAFSPDGARLASGGFDRTARLWDVASGRERQTLGGHLGWVAAVAFSPDGSYLATGSHDHTIRLWDAATGRELATLRGHSGNVYSVAFSPDGELLASGSLDGTVRLWAMSRAPARETAVG